MTKKTYDRLIKGGHTDLVVSGQLVHKNCQMEYHHKPKSKHHGVRRSLRDQASIGRDEDLHLNIIFESPRKLQKKNCREKMAVSNENTGNDEGNITTTPTKTVENEPVIVENGEEEESMREEESTRGESAQKESTRKDSAQKESMGEESVQKESTREDSAQKESTRGESAQKESTRKDSAQKESTGEESTRGESAQKESMGEDSAQKESVGEESTTKKSAQKESVGEESAQKESVGEESPTKKSAQKESVAEESPTKKSAQKESVGEESPTKKSAQKESVGEESMGEDSAQKKSAQKESPRESSPLGITTLDDRKKEEEVMVNGRKRKRSFNTRKPQAKRKKMSSEKKKKIEVVSLSSSDSDDDDDGEESNDDGEEIDNNGDGEESDGSSIKDSKKFWERINKIRSTSKQMMRKNEGDDDDDDDNNDDDIGTLVETAEVVQTEGRSRSVRTSTLSSIKNTDRGRIIWGTMSGYKAWPAIIISHEDCGMQQLTGDKAFIYFFGDHTVDEVSMRKIDDFLKIKPKSVTGDSLHKAVLEGLEELRHQSGLEEMNSEKDLLEWRRDGCQGYRPFSPHTEVQMSARTMRGLMKIQLMADSKRIEYLTSTSTPKDLATKQVVKNWGPKVNELNSVRTGKDDIEKVCIACHQVKCEVVGHHPFFLGGLCHLCLVDVTEAVQAYNDDNDDVVSYIIMCMFMNF
ncbi:hypothetical protein Pcinc_044407 [Petrolisthes cinctipes]|uniref:PWWP domain-containing protein n=1 Tax=Petrolisthes cinctipes TaxID=88211 RepID=A0AAE1EFF2_PETCI|nr:hypothetical protein Pcinc_044407 [Petrolisthes cinctipes]